MYEEDGLRLYMIDVCGQLSFHIDNDIEIDVKRLRHLREVFACLQYVLEQKGIHHLDTWIPPSYEEEIRFAESFGFVKTGFNKVISYENGTEQILTELRVSF